MDVDRDDIARLAAVAFAEQKTADIPEKIWCDYYQGTIFVRATWETGLTVHRIDLLEHLQGLVARYYGHNTVAVAYCEDHDWREIDALAAALQGVE